MSELTLKQKEAIARQEHWANLTPEQKLADLDSRLGKGNGAKKQRERLNDLIENSKSKHKKEE